MKQNKSLFEELKSYNEKGIYPLHMPGHKRGMSLPGVPIAYDFTEVEGTDDLHHAEGILKDSMERTARVFGADRSYYLVNGSTSGNLVGISAMCPLNGELIVARNCHRSVFHALELRNITAHFVYPDFDSDFGIFGGVSPEAVEKLFIKYPDSKGVVLTSPTYEGVVSDVRAIAEVCRRHGGVLFVDEAHGAHFGLVKSSGFPENAVQCGADISVQSAHKTLIGLTQTAFLHIKKGLVDESKVERFIDIYETSSPSYPLMLSLDACTELVLHEGEKVFGDWAETLRLFDERIKSLRHFRVLCHGTDDFHAHGFFDFDKSKLLVNCKKTHLDGEKFMAIMRERFGFELEMQLSQNALAMTGPGDDREQILRFASALLTLDREEEDGRNLHRTSHDGTIPMTDRKDKSPLAERSNIGENDELISLENDRDINQETAKYSSGNDRDVNRETAKYPSGNGRDVNQETSMSSDGNMGKISNTGSDYMSLMSAELRQAVTIQHAVEAESETVEISEAAGRISSEYVYCYPPGVPLVVPGEILDKRCVAGLLSLMEKGYSLRFTKSGQYHQVIDCCIKAYKI